MLAHRVIPTLLCRGRQLVKGKRFNSWRSVGVAAQAVRVHQARGVDELCLLDIGATPEGRGPDLSLVEELSDVCFMPLAVGGGIRTVEQVRDLLKAGADKVVIGTAFVDFPEMKRIAETVGRQALVASIDVADGEVAWNCGRTTVSGGMDPVEYAKLCEQVGAGEILLTSIDREGTMQGYDLELVRRVSSAVSIPVIAHGGCSGYPDMAAAIAAGASAVAAGALFQFTDAIPKEAATYLHQMGIEARV